MKDPERDDLTVAIAKAHPSLPWGMCSAIAQTVIREGWAPELQPPHHHEHARDDGEADPEPSP
jgi:hypothetical protein